MIVRFAAGARRYLLRAFRYRDVPTERVAPGEEARAAARRAAREETGLVDFD